MESIHGRHVYTDESVSCFQDELSDANQGGSKPATLLPAALSGAASASVEMSETEESEGLNRNLNSSSRKPDSSKNIKVQEAVTTKVLPKGKSFFFNYKLICLSHRFPYNIKIL